MPLNSRKIPVLKIRLFQSGDELALREIFFNTIRNVNTQDYTQKQISAWAPDNYDEAAWSERIQSINPFIATFNDVIVGYADIQIDGYIDHFFCHWQYQRIGVGKALFQKILTTAKSNGNERLYAHVSITAKPFFKHVGFKVIKKQQVVVRGQALTNYLMERLIR